MASAPKVHYDADLDAGLKDAPAADLHQIATRCISGFTLTEFVDVYRQHGDRVDLYYPLLIQEILLLGSNSFRSPRPYVEILKDVARRHRVNFKSTSTDVIKIEENLLNTVFETTAEQMTDEERRQFTADIVPKRYYLTSSARDAAPTVLTTLAMYLTKMSAAELATFLARHAAAALAGYGLKVAATPAIARVLETGIRGVSGPAAWAATAASVAYDLAGPAYRIVDPVVLHVAILRRLKNFVQCTGTLDTGEPCLRYVVPANYCPHCGTAMGGDLWRHLDLANLASLAGR